MKKILVVSILLALTGCADKDGNIFNPNLFGTEEVIETAEEVQQVADLQSVPVTANSFSEVAPTYLAANKTLSFALSQQDSLMKLDSGKTFVEVFALPKLEFDQGIHVKSTARESVVVPYVQFLDSDFNPVGDEVSPTFIEKYDQFDALALVSDMADSIRYVAVYSHQDQYGKTSPLFDVERQRKLENGIDVPQKPWLKTTHVPVGKMTIKLERVTSE